LLLLVELVMGLQLEHFCPFCVIVIGVVYCDGWINCVVDDDGKLLNLISDRVLDEKYNVKL
jgi:hypothetical protein